MLWLIGHDGVAPLRFFVSLALCIKLMRFVGPCVVPFFVSLHNLSLSP